MHVRTSILIAVCVLAGCAVREQAPNAVRKQVSDAAIEKVETLPNGTSAAQTLDGYKRDLAQRIVQVNSTHVYTGRPQALLRSVVVLRYAIDADGRLLRSEIMRSNRDRETEATAMASLRSTAPFPKPAAHLLSRGRLEVAETWLFNTDGRFQLRTIAEPQMDQ